MEISKKMMEYYIKNITLLIIIKYQVPFEIPAKYPNEIFDQLSKSLDEYNDKMFFKYGLCFLLRNNKCNYTEYADLDDYDWTNEEMLDLLQEILKRVYNSSICKEFDNKEINFNEISLAEWRKKNPPNYPLKIQ